MPYVKNASGFYPADILVPKEEYLPEWCVPPVDQHTSEPEFWDSLKEAAGSRPSALDLVLPEAYLGTAREEEALRRISHYMKSYLENGCFREIKNSLIRIEREQSTGLFRRGLLGAIDLEEYDFDPDKRPRSAPPKKPFPPVCRPVSASEKRRLSSCRIYWYCITIRSSFCRKRRIRLLHASEPYRFTISGFPSADTGSGEP